MTDHGITEAQFEQMRRNRYGIKLDPNRYDVVIIDKNTRQIVAFVVGSKGATRERAEKFKQMTIQNCFTEEEVFVVLAGTLKMGAIVEKEKVDIKS